MLLVRKMFKFFLYLVCTSSLVVANTDMALYEMAYLGEKKIPSYTESLNPLAQFDYLEGEYTFLDSLYRKNYVQDYTSSEFFSLERMLLNEIPVAGACPNQSLSNNLDYIQYLFRLMSMSYLFESMKEIHVTLHQLGLDRNACSISWHQTFSSCEAKGEEMKKFVKRVQYNLLGDFDRSVYKRMSPKEMEKWQDDFKTLTTSAKSKSIVKARIYEWCKDRGQDCENLKMSEIKKALEQSCSQDRKMIQNICSENDKLYGLSYAKNLSGLIAQSNALNVIDQNGHGRGCLERFVKVFKRKETEHRYLSPLFSVVQESLKDKNSRYIQGPLFLPGSLKEFDDKGLGDFLFKEPDPEPTPVVVKAKPRPKVEKKKAPPPKPVVIPKKVTVKPPVPKKPEPKVVKVSEFLKAHNELLETPKKRVVLNMDEFKDDFVFNEKMRKALEPPLKDYQTRTALIDMKKFDLLGSSNEPVRLIFLKFLIDNNMHQGLFNITAVLGEHFYVTNDIDGDSRAVAIELKNDESTGYRWQITLLEDDQVMR